MAGVVCQHCGTTNPAGARFCSACDEFLDWDGTAETADEAPPAGAAARSQARPTEEIPASPTQPLPPTPPAGPVRRARPVDQPQTYRPVAQPSPAARPSPDAAPPGAERPWYLTAPTQPADATASAGGRAAPFDPTPGRPLVLADTRQCHRCATDNPLQRRFCRRCGEWLVDPTPPVAVAPLSLRRRLRDRWWGGPRTAYEGRLSRSTVVFRILSVTALGLVILLVLGVAGVNPVGRARDYVGHVRGSGRVTGVQAAVDPAAPGDDASAAWATDDVRARGWTTRWVASGAGNPEAACGAGSAPAVAGTLVLTFAAPTDVREIGIEAGLAAKDPLVDARWRPRTLELRWDGGGCQRVDLEKTPELQRFRVDEGRELTGVRISVVAGYQPTAAGQPDADRLDIGEVTFWQR